MHWVGMAASAGELKLKSGVISCSLVLRHVLGPPRVPQVCWELGCVAVHSLSVLWEEKRLLQLLAPQRMPGCMGVCSCPGWRQAVIMWLLVVWTRVPSPTVPPRIQEEAVSMKVVLWQLWLFVPQ